MPNYNFKISDGERSDVIDYIKYRKSLGKFTVIDFGGSANNWCSSFCDAIVDFNTAQGLHENTRFFNMDITHPDSYSDLEDYVNKNGKFDFSICSHTLEDIMNPGFVIEKICKLSNEGYIAVPSKYREMSRFEGRYRGYIHHRWIFDNHDGVFTGYPKINYIERQDNFDSIADLSANKNDLSFYWKDSIDFKYVNDNYLGPSVSEVIKYYNKLL